MEIIRTPQTEDLFASVGAASLLEFRRRYEILHRDSPIRAVKCLLFYLDSRGLDPLSEAMAFYATAGTRYLSVLLDMDSEMWSSSIVLPLLQKLDPQFLFKFARSMGALKDPAAILHALHLAPGLGDYGILIPWLRSLSEHADSRIRSRSAKLLCLLRPNPGLIRRYLQSGDGRTRAAVLEALWNIREDRINHDVVALLRSARSDPYHRVVANALVGLYRLGETASVNEMVTLSSDHQYLVRAATAWAMGAVHDPRAIPALRQLTLDRYFVVRRRASSSLVLIGQTPH